MSGLFHFYKRKKKDLKSSDHKCNKPSWILQVTVSEQGDQIAGAERLSPASKVVKQNSVLVDTQAAHWLLKTLYSVCNCICWTVNRRPADHISYLAFLNALIMAGAFPDIPLSLFLSGFFWRFSKRKEKLWKCVYISDKWNISWKGARMYFWCSCKDSFEGRNTVVGRDPIFWRNKHLYSLLSCDPDQNL